MSTDAEAVLEALRRIPGEAKLSEIESYSKVTGEGLVEALNDLEGSGLVEVTRWRLTAEGKAEAA